MGLYAAYGSNLDPGQMQARCPHSPWRTTGWLAGWRLTFGGEELGWDGPLPTVVEEQADPGAEVFVSLYDISELDEEALDRWESADTGLYQKIRVRISTPEGPCAAHLYVLDAYEGGLPSARTRDTIVDAASAAGAPLDYVAQLLARPVRDDG